MNNAAGTLVLLIFYENTYVLVMFKMSVCGRHFEHQDVCIFIKKTSKTYENDQSWLV